MSVDLVVIDHDSNEVAFSVDPDPLIMRAKIAALQIAMEAGEQVEIPAEETLCDGMYTRTIRVPKGSLIIGKIHRKPCINIVAAGDISILTETGSKRVQAGFILSSPAGMQKVGYAHEDTVFINIFRTDETDITKMEAELISESFDALEREKDQLWLG